MVTANPRPTASVVAVIALGGALGGLARWGLAEAWPHARDGLPWSTMLANVSGALALGVLMVLVVEVWTEHRYIRPFFGVGVLGGYTTFSTYMLDARTLLVEGQAVLAFGYLFGTLLLGLLAVWVGSALGRTAVSRLVR